ncbi:major capsid protein gpP [Lysinibacillus capsici]|uniref:Major capsid protein gpP n=1 Tax=Lysinibacillus capsici TaxID=2115968 RepID=A0A2X0XH75_9BACI|nr:capsid protein [Lysinibacillus capsici]SPT98424.1 major capsid protein gpP [Lysinibacillus capsici]
MSFLLNHGYVFEIGGTGFLPATKLRIAKGITSVDPDSNEESEETYYYDGGGAAERDITGFMLSYAFEGHRNYGDPAQDYIFSLLAKVGPDRKTVFSVTEPNGDKWEGPATISDIKAPGGDANAKGEIEFTISFDGMPTFTAAPTTP